MFYIQILAFAFYFCLPSFADSGQQIKKFEDLFIWKVSDELKLTQKEEDLIGDVIRKTNQKKAKANQELEKLYRQLTKESSDSDRKQVLGKIKKALKAQHETVIEELELLEKGIGLKKLAKYLELKQELTDKLKNIWINNDQKGERKLPPPKIIEEK